MPSRGQRLRPTLDLKSDKSQCFKHRKDLGSAGQLPKQHWSGRGLRTIYMYSRRHKNGDVFVPLCLNRNACLFHSTKMELSGRWSRRQMVRPTTQTVASSNYTPEESKKAEKSTTSVDLLVIDAIWIDQQSEVDRLMIAKIACSQAAITKYAQIRRAAAA